MKIDGKKRRKKNITKTVYHTNMYKSETME